MGFAAMHALESTMGFLSLLCICPSGTSNIEHLFLSSSKVFQSGSGSGQDVQ
jgi:hypothetical protein